MNGFWEILMGSGGLVVRPGDDVHLLEVLHSEVDTTWVACETLDEATKLGMELVEAKDEDTGKVIVRVYRAKMLLEMGED